MIRVNPPVVHYHLQVHLPVHESQIASQLRYLCGYHGYVAPCNPFLLQLVVVVLHKSFSVLLATDKTVVISDLLKYD